MSALQSDTAAGLSQLTGAPGLFNCGVDLQAQTLPPPRVLAPGPERLHCTNSPSPPPVCHCSADMPSASQSWPGTSVQWATPAHSPSKGWRHGRPPSGTHYAALGQVGLRHTDLSLLPQTCPAQGQGDILQPWYNPPHGSWCLLLATWGGKATWARSPLAPHMHAPPDQTSPCFP